MVQFRKLIETAVANRSEAMEDTISKNGRSSKSHTSRGNILRKAFFVLLSAAVVVMGSCDKDKDKTLTKINISDAASLFLAPSSGGTKSLTKSETKEIRLFKITEDGDIVEVDFLDNGGNKIEQRTMMPQMIWRISNSDYFMARFSYKNYLVRKSDGAVFLINVDVLTYDDSPRRAGGFRNGDLIVQDANKNLYCMTGGINNSAERVYKFDVSNPNSITSEPRTPDTENAFHFTVSANGDIFYCQVLLTGAWGSSPRVRKSNGGLWNVPNVSNQINSWTGLDGKIRFLGETTVWNQETGGYNPILKTLNIDNESVEEKILDDVRHIGSSSWENHILRFNNRIVLLSNAGGNVYILEIENATSTPRSIPSPPMRDFKIAVSSNNNIYLSGTNDAAQPVLFKIDVNTGTATSLFAAGAYDIFAMTVSPNDELTFNALRMSDGRKIIGKITSSGQVQVLDESLDSEVVVLERIQ